MLRIAHLVDKTLGYGIARYLEFLQHDHPLAALARHEVHVLAEITPEQDLKDVDMIVSHLGITWQGLPALMSLRSRCARRPLIHVEHRYCEGYADQNGDPGRDGLRTLLRSAYVLFDKVVAVSDAQGAWIARRGLVHPGALTVIPPCVQLEALPLIDAPRGPVRHIGAIGALERQKGFDILIRAFFEVPAPQARLTIYGSGSQESILHLLAKGDDRIRFAGHIDDPFLAHSACDVIAMPSRWEPFGLVALEANAAGRPVMLCPVDGLADQLSRGNIAVADASVPAWVRALREVLDPATPPGLPDRSAAVPERTRAGWSGLIRQYLDPAGEIGSRDRLRLVSGS